VYAGEAVGAGKKSLAYHVLLQSPTATLSEREEQKFLGRLPRQLEPLGAQLRDG
jgi:phenylalanyl-tRNA synthetase beta subunit